MRYLGRRDKFVLGFVVVLGVVSIWMLFNLQTVVAWVKPPTPTPTALPPPVAVAFEDACNYNGRLVTIEGVIEKLPSTVTCQNKRCGLSFWNGKGRGIGIQVSTCCEGVNEMDYLPTKYKDSDLRIRTASRQVARVGDWLVLTGMVEAGSSGGCRLIVQEIRIGQAPPGIATPTP